MRRAACLQRAAPGCCRRRPLRQGALTAPGVPEAEPRGVRPFRGVGLRAGSTSGRRPLRPPAPPGAGLRRRTGRGGAGRRYGGVPKSGSAAAGLPAGLWPRPYLRRDFFFFFFSNRIGVALCK